MRFRDKRQVEEISEQCVQDGGDVWEDDGETELDVTVLCSLYLLRWAQQLSAAAYSLPPAAPPHSFTTPQPGHGRLETMTHSHQGNKTQPRLSFHPANDLRRLLVFKRNRGNGLSRSNRNQRFLRCFIIIWQTQTLKTRLCTIIINFSVVWKILLCKYVVKHKSAKLLWRKL